MISWGFLSRRFARRLAVACPISPAELSVPASLQEKSHVMNEIAKLRELIVDKLVLPPLSLGRLRRWLSLSAPLRSGHRNRQPSSVR